MQWEAISGVEGGEGCVFRTTSLGIGCKGTRMEENGVVRRSQRWSLTWVGGCGDGKSGWMTAHITEVEWTGHTPIRLREPEGGGVRDDSYVVLSWDRERRGDR